MVRKLLRALARDARSVASGAGLRATLAYYARSVVGVVLDRLFRRERWGLYSRFHTFRANRVCPAEVSSSGLDLDALISTTSGVFLYRSGSVRRLLRGRFTGMTRRGDRVYLAEELFETKRSRILSFCLRGDAATDVKHLYAVQSSGGFHQIDFVDDLLWVMDTHNNNVTLLAPDGQVVRRIYPNSVHVANLPNRDPDPRYYGHYNSLFRWRGHVYILANRKSQETEQPSVLYRVDETDHTTVERLGEVPAGENSHNVLICDDGILICDSRNGTLIRDGEVVFSTSYFTRGLAMNDEYVVVGGSERAERYKRAETNSQFWILDRQYRLQCEVDMGMCGQVYDIRLLNGDYGLSNEQKGR